MTPVRHQTDSPAQFRWSAGIMLRPRLTALLAACLLTALPALGTDLLYSKKLSPVAGLLGLPSPRSAALLAEGDWQVAAHNSIASHFVVDSRGVEALTLDGETWRVALDLRYGFSHGWELQLELPWLGHNGGTLD
ncbi:MAG TPA: DUF3187 family protein, partial [Kineobactrum sp.]